MQKKIEKKILVSEILLSEMAAVKSVYYEGNSCHGQSMRKEINFKSLHITKRDFLQRNWLHSDQ